MTTQRAYFYFYILIASFTLVLASCAKPANPTGGPEDDTPPALIVEESTPNFQTRFTDREIVLEFDEFINLSNASKQIVISPPFTDYLKYTVRGKKLIIEFPEGEALREEATYQINFGSAIKDYTAGNELDNFTFVFSTGDVIDSLSVSGSVFDSATGEPSVETLVLLYDNLADTAFQTEKPFYFAKTDDAGRFEINNIKSDTFQVFALSDQNLSLNYDQPNEAIGFIDSFIMLPDTTLGGLNILLFDEREIPSLLNVNQKKKERAILYFSGEPRQISLEGEKKEGLEIAYELKGDSCVMWYKTSLDSFDVYTEWEGVLDTFSIKKIEKKKEASRFVCRSCREDQEIFVGDTIEVEFNMPIGSVDVSMLEQIDSLDQMDVVDVSFDARYLKIFGKIVDTGYYELVLLPGMVKDVFGGDIDTSQVIVEGKSNNVLGNIAITIENVNLERQYIYELLDDNEKLIRTKIMKADSVLSFGKLEEGQYFLKMTEDLNENGYWDSGNLREKRNSEKIREFQLEELRQGWDLETSINIENEF